jgi:UDP-glucuronate 4-epimerase
MTKSVLVTGGAGFIGSHLVEKLLSTGCRVVVVDNFDPFYPRRIKERNIEGFMSHDQFTLIECSIDDNEALNDRLSPFQFDVIVHLAAKAGVRPSIANPLAYQAVNVAGTQNLLELAKNKAVKQFVFASSSSVYGINENYPWSESDHVLKPISPYASSKLSGEFLGHVYAHLFGIRFIALRFFTVYGPRQRPDLAIHKFAHSLVKNMPISFFGDGSTRRDYTYIDDIVKGIEAAMHYTGSMYEIINLGNHRTVSLAEMLQTLENIFNKKARIEYLDQQPGDVPFTFAKIDKAKKILGFAPSTDFEDGIRAFREWFYQTELIESSSI